MPASDSRIAVAPLTDEQQALIDAWISHGARPAK
jgi:hypothetical protein